MFRLGSENLLFLTGVLMAVMCSTIVIGNAVLEP